MFTAHRVKMPWLPRWIDDEHIQLVLLKYSSNGVQQSLLRVPTLENEDQYPIALALDQVGNAVVLGASEISAGRTLERDFLTFKCDSAASILWEKYYDYDYYSNGRAIALELDSLGNVYVTGTSNSDYATVKYNDRGEQQWAARYDFNGESAAAIAVDAQSNVYVTGSSGDSYPDYATVMYDASGQQQLVSRFDRRHSDVAYAIAVDRDGNAFVTGNSWQEGPHGAGTSHDYATIKYNSEGESQWVAIYATSAVDYARDIALDNAGNVYVTGNGFLDYVTIKYNRDGEQQWLARYQGTAIQDDFANALTLDSFGNIYVTGKSIDAGSDYDYATVKYNSAGEQLWAARYNGPGNGGDNAVRIAGDAWGNVIVTGTSKGINSNLDLATVKYDSTGKELWVARLNGPANLNNNATGLRVDLAGNIYVTGTIKVTASDHDFITVSTF